MITKSSTESAKREQRAGEDPRRDQRQRDPRERRPLVRAEVHRRLLEVAVEADEPRLHGHDDERDVEHDVRDADRPEAGRDAEIEEERQQRGAEDDLGRRHRQEDEEVRRAAAAERVADERERDQRPQRRWPRCDASAAISMLSDASRPGEPGDAERVPPVVEREALHV